MSTNPLACEALPPTKRDLILTGLTSCWQAWLENKFPARDLPQVSVRLAFQEKEEEVLHAEAFAHDLVAACAKQVRREEISLKLPIDRPCHAEELPPDFLACWSQFAVAIARADREGRVAWEARMQ